MRPLPEQTTSTHYGNLPHCTPGAVYETCCISCGSNSRYSYSYTTCSIESQVEKFYRLGDGQLIDSSRTLLQAFANVVLAQFEFIYLVHSDLIRQRGLRVYNSRFLGDVAVELIFKTKDDARRALRIPIVEIHTCLAFFTTWSVRNQLLAASNRLGF